jgi:hypothetical protein
MKKQVLLIALTTLSFVSIGCSGTMKGIDRYSGKRVFFSYTGEKFGSAEIQVTMPDGELLRLRAKVTRRSMNLSEIQRLFCKATGAIT